MIVLILGALKTNNEYIFIEVEVCVTTQIVIKLSN